MLCGSTLLRRAASRRPRGGLRLVLMGSGEFRSRLELASDERVVWHGVPDRRHVLHGLELDRSHRGELFVRRLPSCRETGSCLTPAAGVRRTLVRRFWFEFERAPGEELPGGVRIGCGVTAENAEVALALVAERVFGGATPPHVTRMVPDVDISRLDQAHVIPNMGCVTRRGVWFPLGYASRARTSQPD